MGLIPAAFIGRTIGAEVGGWLGEQIGIKGKFEKHKKFFYFIGPQDSSQRVMYENFFVFLKGSHRLATDTDINNLMNGGWWQHCPQCVKAGGAKHPYFHIEEKSSGQTCKLKTIGGLAYNTTMGSPAPGVLPPGIPNTQENKSKVFPPESVVATAPSHWKFVSTTKLETPPVSTAPIYTPEIETEESIAGKPIALAGLGNTTTLLILGGLAFFLFKK